MPQLPKGGKYVLGLSRVRQDSGICISDEAMHEYYLKPNEQVILMSGSKTPHGQDEAVAIVQSHVERIHKKDHPNADSRADALKELKEV
jgi:hypothetical protein